MTTRVPLSKKTRFEVFKRDRFTCQYCGAKAPDVVLHVDHVQPVADGGTNDLLNLLTACQGCNAGKGARRLDDSTEVTKQRAQLEELQDRREQIEMLLEWREALAEAKRDSVDIVAEAIEKASTWGVNEAGRADIKRWLKRYSLELLLRAVDESFETYLQFRGDEPSDVSWNKAFAKVPAVANVIAQEETKPYLRDLFYIQGIVRKRTGAKWYDCLDLLEAAVKANATMESLTRFAKGVNDIDEFEKGIGDFLAKQARKE